MVPDMRRSRLSDLQFSRIASSFEARRQSYGIVIKQLGRAGLNQERWQAAEFAIDGRRQWMAQSCQTCNG